MASYTDLVAAFRDLTRYPVKTPDAPGLTVAYSYLRFSSPGQAEGDSVRRQTDLREAWLRKHPSVRLDTSLKLLDDGVSGFTGDHRKKKKHSLYQFLDLVERGRVPAGSFLIIENLDRLSREHPLEILSLVANLVRAGVRIVQLEPECVFTADMDEGTLCMLLLGAMRGHGESKRKSSLCGAAWQNLKAEARKNKAPHGSSCPAWIELAEGKYRLVPARAEAVRLVFRWSIEGLGSLAITRRLIKEGVPPIGRARRWNRSYVAKILDNRAVLGEYQPMSGHHQRRPDGDPIPDYYPRVISDADWHRAHSATQDRNLRSGRPGRKGDYTFAFSGLLSCALDQCKLHVIIRRGKRFLVSADAVGGRPGAHWRAFPLEPLVDALLSQMQELRAHELFSAPGGEKVAEVKGRLLDVEKLLAVALARFEADPESTTWADRVSQYDRQKRALVVELARARQDAANPLGETWAEAVQMMKEREPDRLHGALLATVEQVWCVIVPRGQERRCACQVVFKGGQRRGYLISYVPPIAGFCTREASWSALSFDRCAEADLRDRSQAAAVAEELVKLP